MDIPAHCFECPASIICIGPVRCGRTIKGNDTGGTSIQINPIMQLRKQLAPPETSHYSRVQSDGSSGASVAFQPCSITHCAVCSCFCSRCFIIAFRAWAIRKGLAAGVALFSDMGK